MPIPNLYIYLIYTYSSTYIYTYTYPYLSIASEEWLWGSLLTCTHMFICDTYLQTQVQIHEHVYTHTPYSPQSCDLDTVSSILKVKIPRNRLSDFSRSQSYHKKGATFRCNFTLTLGQHLVPSLQYGVSSLSLFGRSGSQLLYANSVQKGS